MYTGALKSQDGEILMGAIFVMLTNWDSVEAREGRRGRYLTTGALSFRMRSLPDEVKSTLITTLNSIGMDMDDEALTEVFSGMHEYQVSFSVNRFESRTGQVNLSRREQAAIDKVVELLKNKPEAVREAFPLLRKAG